MIFCNLGSGSKGNCSYIESGSTSILIDQGFSKKQLVLRMDEVKLNPEKIDAIILTHNHSDHAKGIGVFARKYNTPVYITKQTESVLNSDILKKIDIKHFISGDTIQIKDLKIKTFVTPHDAQDPVGLFITDTENKTIGHLTDVGMVSQSIIQHLGKDNLDILFLESNHDLDMLRTGPYPIDLQRRVKSRVGHLSNDQAIEMFDNLNCNGRLKHLILGHLSEQNNDQKLVSDLFKKYKKKNSGKYKIHIAKQNKITKIINI